MTRIRRICGAQKVAKSFTVQISRGIVEECRHLAFRSLIWRIRPFASFPSDKKLEQIFSGDDLSSRMLVASAMTISPSNALYIEGTLFGGTEESLRWWVKEYYGLVEKWLEEGRFAGKDQDLMTDIFHRNRNRFITLRSIDQNYYDPCFFFQIFLSASNDWIGEETKDPRLMVDNLLDSPYIEVEKI